MIDGIPIPNVAILGAATFLVSLLVSAIGPTGGMQLAAVAATMPAAVVLPIHAWTTGFSALFRAIALRQFIDWRYLRRFLPASAVGAAVVALLYARAQLWNLQLVVAIYIMLTSLGELARIKLPLVFKRSQPAAEGLITGLLSMVIGASGPLLMTLMQPHQSNKERLVGTFSAGLTFQHLVKLLAFGLIGVSVLAYPRILVMITIAAAVGTWAGRHVLMRIREDHYRRALSILLLATSVWLILDSVRR